MNIRQALAKARSTLSENNIEEASLESEILLRHVLGVNRACLFSDLESGISAVQIENFIKLVGRRSTGEPTAYITGHKEFYGLDFEVDRRVLIPRPETELLVEKAISLAKNNNIAKIADIGTGCGAIAISLALNLPQATVYATDVSSLALEVAAENSKKHYLGNRVILLQGGMLGPLPERVDMIVANMPYVRKSELAENGPLSFEPQLALDGGENGTDKIKLLCLQAGDKLNANGFLIMEIGKGQWQTVKSILHNVSNIKLIEIAKDLAGIERVISLRLT